MANHSNGVGGVNEALFPPPLKLAINPDNPNFLAGV